MELPVESARVFPVAPIHCMDMLQLVAEGVYIHADVDHSCPAAAGARLLYAVGLAALAVSFSTLFVAAVSPMGPFTELAVSAGTSLTRLVVPFTMEDPLAIVVELDDQAGPVVPGTVVSVPGVESIWESFMWFMVYSGNACTLCGGSIVVFVVCVADQADVWAGVVRSVLIAKV